MNLDNYSSSQKHLDIEEMFSLARKLEEERKKEKTLIALGVSPAFYQRLEAALLKKVSDSGSLIPLCSSIRVYILDSLPVDCIEIWSEDGVKLAKALYG